jgi:peptidoglycan/xylan/chitin deacetylase (PgdA/CDA1 family)
MAIRAPSSRPIRPALTSGFKLCSAPGTQAPARRAAAPHAAAAASLREAASTSPNAAPPAAIVATKPVVCREVVAITTASVAGVANISAAPPRIDCPATVIRRPLLGTAVALAAIASTALAAAPAPPLRIEQAPLTSGPLDLASATFGQVRGRLEVTIVTRGDWTPDQLVPADQRRLCVVVTPAGPSARTTTACVVAAAKDAIGLRVGGRVTPVAARRPDGRTVVLEIDPALLDVTVPGLLQWQISSAWTDATACPPASACHDRLPAAGPASYRTSATQPIGCTRSGPALRRHGSRSSRAVALTFDDGPWPDTPGFVGLLEREHAPATFFVIGRQVAGHGALLRRELDDGDAIGNHTYTHPFLTRTRDARAQLEQTSAAIEQAAGYAPCVFRPPYGAVDAAVVDAALGQRMSTIVWDVDPSDYARPGTAAIVRRVLSHVRNGSIVLMHDGGGDRGQTLAALPQIIAGLRARGYALRTVPALLGYRTLYA